jgi:D-serine deaminase-like pyridoxal phosphate-dependent protein
MLHPEIDTPAAVVDLDMAEDHIAKFQKYLDGHGIPGRPHIKTHKLPQLAKAQLASGAHGITCQKISEAEAMIAGGGIDNVLLTYNILGSEKLARLRALSERVRLSVVADNSNVVAGLAEAFRDARTPLHVLVECDTGAKRCGVATGGEALVLAREIAAAPGLHFAGLMTYPPAGDPAAVQAWLAGAKSLIEAAGLAVEVVSCGGTPDMWRAHEVPVATEWRAGTYAYNDGSLVARGLCGYDDCALVVLATVVSRPDVRRAIIDAGSKALTSDLLGLEGYGHVLGHEDIMIDQLSEEHGRLVSEQPIVLEVGERVRIVPNHVCVVTNMFDWVATLRDGKFAGYLPVVARGCVT